jgi:hypothetical protein
MPASLRIVSRMQRKRNILRSSPLEAAKLGRLELHPDRAFVLHLNTRAQLPHRVVGRVEHVTSGQIAHVTCAAELMAFMAKVLAQPRPGRASSSARKSRPGVRQSGVASSKRSPLDENGCPS